MNDISQMDLNHSLAEVKLLIDVLNDVTSTYTELGECAEEQLPYIEHLVAYVEAIRPTPTTHDSKAEFDSWDDLFFCRKSARDAVERVLIDGGERAPNGCLRWTGVHIGGGYGQVKVGDKWELVHRVAHEIWIGPIPDGLEIDHVKAKGCEFRDCFEPTHLEAVTHRENILRAVRKTECPQGHPYSGDNLYIRPSGQYKCRACNRNRERRRAEERKALANGQSH